MVIEYLESFGFELFKRRGIQKVRKGPENKSNKLWYWKLDNPAEVYRKRTSEKLYQYIVVCYSLRSDQSYNKHDWWSGKRANKTGKGLEFLATGYYCAELSSFRPYASKWITLSINQNKFHGNTRLGWNCHFNPLSSGKTESSMRTMVQETRKNGIPAKIIFNGSKLL